MDGAHRFAALDSLRGVCALGVALFHFHTEGVLTNLPSIRRGWMLVDFFFVLSGFVLAHAYWGRIGKDVRPLRFLALRLGRIYPLHLAVLLVMVALELLLAASGDALAHRAAFAPGHTGGELLASLLLLNSSGLLDRLVWNGPSWSIAAEFWAYVLFAAVAMTGRLWLFALAGGGAGLALLLLHPDLYDASFDFGTLRCLYGFSLGVLVWAWRGEPTWRPSPALATAAELLMIAAVIGFTAMVWGGPLTLIAPILFAAAVSVFADDAGLVSRLFGTVPFALLGTLSYSIYMVHPFVQARLMEVLARAGLAQAGATDRVTATGWTADAIAIVMVAIMLVVAALTYRWIERPGRAWSRRRFGAPPEERAAPTF